MKSFGLWALGQLRVPQVGVLADLCFLRKAQVSEYRDLWHPRK